MPARIFRLLPLILTAWLASCAPNEAPPLAIVRSHVADALSEPSPAARKAAVRKQLAAVCPRLLSDEELEWAASFVEENRSKGAAWVAGRLLQMHRETKICRGIS